SSYIVDALLSDALLRFISPNRRQEQRHSCLRLCTLLRLLHTPLHAGYFYSLLDLDRLPLLHSGISTAGGNTGSSRRPGDGIHVASVTMIDDTCSSSRAVPDLCRKISGLPTNTITGNDLFVSWGPGHG